MLVFFKGAKVLEAGGIVSAKHIMPMGYIDANQNSAMNDGCVVDLTRLEGFQNHPGETRTKPGKVSIYVWHMW